MIMTEGCPGGAGRCRCGPGRWKSPRWSSTIWFRGQVVAQEIPKRSRAPGSELWDTCFGVTGGEGPAEDEKGLEVLVTVFQYIGQILFKGCHELATCVHVTSQGPLAAMDLALEPKLPLLPSEVTWPQPQCYQQLRAAGLGDQASCIHTHL